MKKILALLLALVMIFGLVGCGGGEAGGAEGDTIKIGVNYELSGAVATYGQSSLDGVELAIDEINAAGGVNGYTVVARVEDDQADPAQAVQAYATLFDDGMDVTMGGTTSGACIAITEEAVTETGETELEEPAEDDHARQLPEPVPHGELLGVRVLEPYAER